MERTQARQLIRETFERPFEKARFTVFSKNLLNHMEEDLIHQRQGQYIPEAYRSHIGTFERIGKYHDGEQRIDILIVKLKKGDSLERARTSQRNFIAGYLQGKYGSANEKEAALVAFVSPDAEEWRFSLVRLDYAFAESEDGKIKAKQVITPAKRWSFLVGAGEKSHTAQSRLVGILADDERAPKLAELEYAFNIETVTNEFFNEYRNLFIRTKEALDAVIEKDAKIKADFEAKDVNSVDFAKKLLGQIVFLYFLQKKGWFGVGREDDWGTGSKQFLRELFEKKHSDYRNFFNDILEPLFYEALRWPRDEDYFSLFKMKIPFLNGGLFDPIGKGGGYEWVQTDIELPDILFSNTKKTAKGDGGDGILDIFDRYNFTVKEDEPLEKEVAIDPELLGKAYEKFNAIRPDNFEEYKKALKSGKKGDESKFNKQFGVYYTPREIVHYMCRESLISYLAVELCSGVTAHEIVGDPHLHLFGNEGKRGQLDITIQHRERENISRDDIETLIYRGEQTRENDARVEREGRETKNYSYSLPEGIRKKAGLIDRLLENIIICDPAVGSGAFPVGMMSEIVRIRTVLSTFMEEKASRTPYDFKRHCIEHSLYGVDIDPGAVEIAKLRLWLSLIVDEEDIKTIKPLPNLDYKIVCGNSLIGLPAPTLKDVDLAPEIEMLKNAYLEETNPITKKQLKNKIDGAFKRLVQDAQQYTSTVLDTDFDFNIHFSEVFHEKEGFDVVIGNPPYVRQEQIKEYKSWFKAAYTHCYAGTADIYVYFYEKGLELLHKGGILAFITSNKYMRASYGERLRRYLSTSTTIRQLIDFGDAPVFEATAYPSIIILEKAKPQNGKIKALDWQRSTPVADFEQAAQKSNLLILQKELTADGWRIESPAALRLLEKLRKAGTPLGEYVNGRFYRGILTGLNEAFVVDRATRDRLIAEHPSSEEVLKPFLRGRDVKRWRVDFAEQCLIKIESSENKQHPWSGKKDNEAESIFAETYPAIYGYLESYRDKLIKRDDQGKYFWELRSCKYWREFEQPKIVYPNICKRNEFAWDDKCFFTNQKAFIIPRASKYLLGILNSKVVFWLFEKLLAKLQHDYYEPSSIFMKDFPIPKIEHVHVDKIEFIVDEIIRTIQKNATIDINDKEHEIDELVYMLYGLAKDEIAIIERGVISERIST